MRMGSMNNPPISPTPKPWIAAIRAYVPGRSETTGGQKLVKLSANENPLGTCEAAKAALAQYIDPSLYPDPDARALREGIGALHSLNPARIICGTGSGELLSLAAQSYAGPGDEVLFSRHSFSLYAIAARRCGAAPIEAPDRDFACDVDVLLAAVNAKTRVVFIANPNNPTGTYLPRSELERLHAGLPQDVLLVVDQAYGEYVPPQEDDDAFVLAASHQNVLITRTFSKIYGLAGERIGWATGHEDIIAALGKIRGPFNVSAHGQAAALAALGDQKFVTQSRAHNHREYTRCTRFFDGLANHGIRALPSYGNFILVLFEGRVTAGQAHAALEQGGYAVRHFPSDTGGKGQEFGLDNALRITIGTAEQMEGLRQILRQLVDGVETQ